MFGRRAYLLVLPLVVGLLSCKKVYKDVLEYFPTVTLVSATKMSDGTVEVVAQIESEGASSLSYIGFCMNRDTIPEMLDNQILVNTLSGSQFTAVYDGFDPYARYAFRPWAANQHGRSYGDILWLDSISAEPVIPPCSHPVNTVDFGYGQGNKTINDVSSPGLSGTYWDVHVTSNTGGTMDLRFGSKPKTGQFQIVTTTSPSPNTVAVSFHSGFVSAGITGDNVYVNQLSPTTWEMTLCDAPYKYNSFDFTLSAKFKCPL